MLTAVRDVKTRSNKEGEKLRLEFEGLIKSSEHLKRADVFVKVRHQEIILSGRVRSFYHKQVAQECIKPAIRSGMKVTNELLVSTR